MINLFEPQVGDESVALLREVFRSKWLGRGVQVVEFEKRLASWLRADVRNIHTISCCTDAIFGVFKILGIEAGAEVIVPSVSFPAVGSSILAAQLTPRIVDIDARSGNIDFSRIADVLSSRTAAVFATHYGGLPVNIPQLRQLVGERVQIIEDAACALGTYVNGAACGTEGDFGCWSFDAMKLLTCGEGGAIYVRDATKLAIAKEYFYLGLPSQAKSGIDRQATDSRWWEYQLNILGRRSVFTNINAAIGLPQFDALTIALERRQAIRSHYCSVLDRLSVDYIRQEDPDVTFSNYFFTVLTPRRDELAAFLKKQQIYSSFRYYPLHLIDLFREYAEDCPASDVFANTALNIPIHQGLSDANVAYIGDMLKQFFR